MGVQLITAFRTDVFSPHLELSCSAFLSFMFCFFAVDLSLSVCVCVCVCVCVFVCICGNVYGCLYCVVNVYGIYVFCVVDVLV